MSADSFVIPAGVAEYVTCRPADLPGARSNAAHRGIVGSEVFLADLRPRTEPLYRTDDALQELRDELHAAGVRRLHSSYWASPTAFVAGVGYRELVNRFGNQERLREYFGDLSGRHMLSRWCDEYALARSLGADAYVFHLIDYQPVDGAWEFTVDRQVVLDAMVVLVQRFLRELEDRALIDEHSPVIELENAGWGLEFGAQTPDDFAFVLERVEDHARRLRVAWDLNHLLHATGVQGGHAAFLLPEQELTPVMRTIAKEADGDLARLVQLWIEANVLDPRTAGRTSTLHISDCAPKEAEFFRNGLLRDGYRHATDWASKQAEGLAVVLEHYDSHLCVGDGSLDPEGVTQLIEALIAARPEGEPLMVLHELKNSERLWEELDRQRQALWHASPAVAGTTSQTQSMDQRR